MATLRYIEQKSGDQDHGPAWIARVQQSKTGRTVYFNGHALRMTNRGVKGNYFDIETGEEFWISGIKKDGTDRHWAGSGFVMIESSDIAEYLELTGAPELDRSRFRVIADLPKTSVENFHHRENQSRHNFTD